MIGRHGNQIYVGWSTTEMMWLEAALTLPKVERTSAYQDIATMSGRPATAVRRMAYRVIALKRDEDLKRMRQKPRQVKRPEPMPPSTIRLATLAQLMGAR